jgi:glycine/D-amino acid oxidase-like deaminating enzyme
MPSTPSLLRAVPVWLSELAPSELRRLNPGVPSDLERRPDVLIVGGGSIGLATAVAVRRAGLGRVLVLEKGAIASSATRHSAGILGPEPHVWSDPPAFVAFGRQSLRLTRELDSEWDRGIGLRDFTCVIAGLRLEDAPAPIEAPVERLDAAAVRLFEPEACGVADALVIRDQARVNPSDSL